MTWRDWLRGDPAAATRLTDVVRATTFGSEQDAARAAELWAMRQKEQEQRDAEQRREAAIATEIAASVKARGFWFPGDAAPVNRFPATGGILSRLFGGD